jgi:hypothetical protein
MASLHKRGNLTFFTSGSLPMKSLEFPSSSWNVILNFRNVNKKHLLFQRWTNHNLFTCLSTFKSSIRFLINVTMPFLLVM